MPEIGHNIRQLRNEQGLTLDELSSKVAINPSSLYGYEINSTEPKLATLEKLANFFNVSVLYIEGVDDTLRDAPFQKRNKDLSLDRLTQLRKSRGLTRISVGKDLNIGRASLYNYENGINEPSLEIWIKLADFYKVPVGYIQGYTDIPELDKKLEIGNDKKIELSNRLRELRKSKGLTQTQLQDKLDINRGTLASYEKGTTLPSYENGTKLADFYGVPVDYLLGLDRRKSHPDSPMLESTKKLWQLEEQAERGDSTAQTKLDIINGILDQK